MMDTLTCPLPDPAGPTLHIELIHDLADDLLLPWLELYETAFPHEERNLVSDILSALKPGATGDDARHLLAATGPDEQFAGLAMYGQALGGALTVLWYLAIVPGARGRGYGSQLYREVVQRARAAGCRALLLEVEIPERAHTPAGQAQAEARIRLYRRLGARLLRGVNYLQSVGWHEIPIPMYLMIQPLADISAAEAVDLVQDLAGDLLTRTGTPAYD